LCQAPRGATVWVLGKGSSMVVIGPAQWIPIPAVLTQNNVVTHNNDCSKYMVEGHKVTYEFALSVTGVGTAGNGVTVNLPIQWGPGALVTTSGGFQIYDASTATRYGGLSEIAGGGSRVASVGDWSGGSSWGTIPNIALAAGDAVRGMAIYEIA
jgi:hypothetical protein